MPVGQTYIAAPIFNDLGEKFGDAVEAANFPKTILRFRNQRQAKTVGLDSLSEDEWLNHFGRFQPLPHNLTKPIAQAYHGHQFRQYNPDIGDGRGFLFAQLKDDQNRILDLGTKGSGTTPYSREGDGRLTLKGGVREILATEMLEALGVNTSKSFSLIETGEQLMRGDEPSPTRSSVLVRLSHGHIRIGTFQRLAYFSEKTSINKLVNYVLTHYYNEVPTDDTVSNALKLLSLVAQKTAQLAAETMAAGFVHGVLNSDNINVTGESFDYGPWRFLPTMVPDFTAAYFDHTGLYSYGRQPEAIYWDLYQFGGCLADIVPEQDLKEILGTYPALFDKALSKNLLRRLGVRSKGKEQDEDLLKAMNKFLIASELPYEQLFFDWYGGKASIERAGLSPLTHMYAHETFSPFLAMLGKYEPRNKDALDHPFFKKSEPCTLLIEEVEDIWSHIEKQDDWSVFEDKISSIREMGEALA